MLNMTTGNDSGDSNIWTNPLATNNHSASLDNISQRVSFIKLLNFIRRTKWKKYSAFAKYLILNYYLKYFNFM